MGRLLKLVIEARDLSQYALADLILRNLEELKEEPVIRATIEKAERLRELKRVLKPGDLCKLQNALSIVEAVLAEVGDDE